MVPTIATTCKLGVRWLQYFRVPWKEPTDEIKSYFGEKIGLYFLWLGHYTTWCALYGEGTLGGGGGVMQGLGAVYHRGNAFVGATAVVWFF